MKKRITKQEKQEIVLDLIDLIGTHEGIDRAIRELLAKNTRQLNLVSNALDDARALPVKRWWHR